MDMKSILTTLDVLNQQKAKSADIIAEDEIEEELTLEELEALEEDDELEEATMDDWYKAGGWKRTSRSQEKTPGGTLRKTTYVQDDEEEVLVYDENGRVFLLPKSDAEAWVNENPEKRGLAESDEEIEKLISEGRLDENPLAVAGLGTALASAGRAAAGPVLKYLRTKMPGVSRVVDRSVRAGAKAAGGAAGFAKRHPFLATMVGIQAVKSLTSDDKEMINDFIAGRNVDLEELKKVIAKYKDKDPDSLADELGVGESVEVEEGLVKPDGEVIGVAKKEKAVTKTSKSAELEPRIENEPRKGIYGTKKFVKDDDNELSRIAKLAGLEEGLFGGYKTRQEQLDAQEAEAMGKPVAKPKKDEKEKEVEEGHDMVPYADPELDFEGDMAKNQLARIMLHAEHLSSMLEDNENMPEWVQSKITKALDYISTAHDYLMGEEYKD